MPIRINCECGKELEIQEQYAGKRGKCPGCGKTLQIPFLDINSAQPDTNCPLAMQTIIEPQIPVNLNAECIPPEIDTVPKTLIDKLRYDYLQALQIIDNDVGKLIQAGKEMRALQLQGENIDKIVEIHKILSNLYSPVYYNVGTLERFGTERLKQLGQYPLPIRATIHDAHSSEAEIEGSVIHNFHSNGIRKKHWLIREILLVETEYMLDALQIIVEPDFIPLESGTPDSENDVDRYIPSTVKLAVWRRDQGKCVQCGTKEKLEYDHIIPVSKGGSSTERNIQLLCEKCNREKAARIA